MFKNILVILCFVLVGCGANNRPSSFFKGPAEAPTGQTVFEEMNQNLAREKLRAQNVSNSFWMVTKTLCANKDYVANASHTKTNPDKWSALDIRCNHHHYHFDFSKISN